MMPSNKKFGNFFSLIFLLISIFFLYKLDFLIFSIFSFLTIITFTITLIAPKYLKIFNIGWFKLGILLNAIISPVILGFIFFGLITPLSLILRLFGRDELKLKINDKKTNWKKYEKNEIMSKNFFNQF
tara:strand:+ start:96 stop:479 length:384 start_codon:yes stop_codon:yes gene_type:complete